LIRAGPSGRTALRGSKPLWRVERRRRNFTTGPSPTGPQVLHQRDQRRIHGPSPCSIASPITHVASLAVERRRRNFTTGPSPTGPQVLHQRDQRRIHGPSPCSIASPIIHVASLAQSTVSHPRRRASPEHGLRIVSGFANQTLRVLSSNRILLPHLLSMHHHHGD
jgi:hypothetical protein